MKKITLSPTVSFKMYDSIESLPVFNYNKFQKYMIYESGLGSSLSEVLGSIQKIQDFIIEEKVPEAIEQANNCMASWYLALNEVSPTQLSFGCFIHSVNGVKLEEYDEAEIKEHLEYLSENGLTVEILEREYLELKKKWMPSLGSNSPNSLTTKQ